MASVQELISNVVDTHHVYLRRELPRLEAIVAKMSANHGHERPELFHIQQLLQDLGDDISAHLLKEEGFCSPTSPVWNVHWTRPNRRPSLVSHLFSSRSG